MRAGVQRRRLRVFEEGGNVTLETLAKILEQLPDVRTIDFGGVEIRIPRSDQRDLRSLREAMAGFAAGARKMAEDGDRVIELLDRLIGEPVDVELPAPEAPEPPAPEPPALPATATGPVGATRYQGSITEQRRAEELQKVADDMRRRREERRMKAEATAQKAAGKAKKTVRRKPKGEG
jgi:hypothetical protein